MATIEEYATQSRDDRLKRLERAADELAAAIAGQTAATLAKRPDEKSWAGVEVICHLRDVEESFGARFQIFLAADGTAMLPADVDRWAIDRQYLRCDAGEAVEAFRKRRAENVQTFRALTPDQWTRGGIHPQRGKRTFEDVLNVLCAHDDAHLDQLKRAIAGRA